MNVCINSSMIKYCVPITVILGVIYAALNVENPDLIQNLPGFNDKIPFKQYSGYLKINENKFFHYWFVESLNEPFQDPLVLWLNGGPGCSSLEGLIGELGPFHIKDRKGQQLYFNNHTWNKMSNIIFLESPAGVGYSYDLENRNVYDDDTVSLDNYMALQSFFAKFPQFIQNDFYVTGESYGGFYVPTLAYRIIQDMPKNGIKLKGIAIGNGLLSVPFNDQSVFPFAYAHGIVGHSQWIDLIHTCCGAKFDTYFPDQLECNFTDPISGACLTNVRAALKLIFDAGLNDYALYSPCDTDPNPQYSVDRYSGTPLQNYQNKLNFLFSEPFGIPIQKTTNLWLSSQILSQLKSSLRHLTSELFNNDREMVSFKTSMSESPPCIDSSAIRNWLNRDDVRQALHIPTHVGKWDICSENVGQGYTRLYSDMYKHIRALINANMRVLIYNGDTDVMCNFIGAEWFVYGLALKARGIHQTWQWKGQVAGFVDYYEKNVTFVTVKGAGHMVPQWKPGPAFHMISAFLQNKPL